MTYNKTYLYLDDDILWPLERKFVVSRFGVSKLRKKGDIDWTVVATTIPQIFYPSIHPKKSEVFSTFNTCPSLENKRSQNYEFKGTSSFYIPFQHSLEALKYRHIWFFYRPFTHIKLFKNVFLKRKVTAILCRCTLAFKNRFH